MKKYIFIAVFFGFLAMVFFWKVWAKGSLPLPTDALVGMYHPFRDYFDQDYPNGVPYKNFLITDPVLQQYPWRWLAMETWRNGKIPWENPYNFSGTPLLANIQTGAFYPFNLVFWLGKFSSMWSLLIIFQPVLAGIFMTLWLNKRKLSLLASLLGGVTWAFSSFNMVWLEWGNMGHAGLYLPLALLAVDKLKKNLKWLPILVLAMSMSLLAGHIQITFYLVTATGLYALLNKKFVLFLVSGFLFLMVTFFQWYPTLKFTLNSNRSVEQTDVLKREGFFIAPKQLTQIIAPDFFGNPATLNYRGEWNYAEQIIYVGIVPLILGLSTILLKGKSRILRFAWLLVAGGLLFSVKNPIAEIPYKLKLPILSGLQPTRLSYLITFGLAILAAMGLEGLIISFNKSVKSMFKIISGIGVIFLVLLIISSKFILADKIISQRNLIWPAVIHFLFLPPLIFLYLTRTVIPGRTVLKKRWPILFSVFCLLLTVFDLFRFGWKFTPFSPREYLYPVTPAIKFLQDNMEPRDRYMTLDRRILPPNANIMYGIKTIEGYDPIYFKEYAKTINEMEGGISGQDKSFGRIIRPINYRSEAVKFLGVKYVLSLTDMSDEFLEKVFQEGETRIYELENNI